MAAKPHPSLPAMAVGSTRLILLLPLHPLALAPTLGPTDEGEEQTRADAWRCHQPGLVDVDDAGGEDVPAQAITFQRGSKLVEQVVIGELPTILDQANQLG